MDKNESIVSGQLENHTVGDVRPQAEYLKTSGVVVTVATGRQRFNILRNVM